MWLVTLKYLRTIVLLVGMVGHVPCAFAQHARPIEPVPQQYTKPAPVKRLALVVGNATYESELELPGTPADVVAIKVALTGAGFEVYEAIDVTRAEFLQLHLKPFLAKITRDDFIVFYFAGHGFNYSGHNYLVPIRFARDIYDSEIPDHFISVTAVQDLLAEQRPGFLLMLLDACRNIKTFISPKRSPQFDANREQTIEKGLYGMRANSANVVIGFSSDAGKVSLGFSAAGRVSYYTAALAKFIPKEDAVLEDVQREVRTHVLWETKEKQDPWFSHGSSAQVYFTPTEKIAKQEEDAWLSVYYGKVKKDVFRFLKHFSVSRFVKAAREYYDQLPDEVEEAFTRISPLGPELAWVDTDDAKSSHKAIKLKRIESPLAFGRDAPGDLSKSIDFSELAFDKNSETGSAEGVFVKHGTAILTGPLAARAKPSYAAKILASLPMGTIVDVHTVRVDQNKQLWAEVGTPGLKTAAFVSLFPTTIGITDIGVSLAQIRIPALKNGVLALAEVEPAINVLKGLRSSGRTIQWISIATPLTDSDTKHDLFRLRAAHLKLELEKAGVARQRISLVEKATDLVGQDLRVKVFGN